MERLFREDPQVWKEFSENKICTDSTESCPLG